MGFVNRFGGWRPIQMEEGAGVIRLPGEITVGPVEYRFEVWHQMVDGFPGPFRAEGEWRLAPEAELDRLSGRAALLVLEDGRFLPVKLSGDGRLLAHDQPSTVEPSWPESMESNDGAE